jgi:signal transduction histidine kinase
VSTDQKTGSAAIKEEVLGTRTQSDLNLEPDDNKPKVTIDSKLALFLSEKITDLNKYPVKSVQSLATNIALITTKYAKANFSGLFLKTRSENKHLTLSGWSSLDSKGKDIELDINRPLHIDLEQEWLMDLKEGRVVFLDRLAPEFMSKVLGCSVAEVERIFKQLPLKTLYICRMEIENTFLGLFISGYLEDKAVLEASDLALIGKLSGIVASVVHLKQLKEENYRLRHTLKESNTKLTSLDEAKDDFISMASHQLRTPLTTIKGCLSIVIDGDAGEINSKQKDMLTQAFSSCQIMVYIIADLLNVSRLRTGKFLLTPSKTDLSDVVRQEVDDLKKMAKAKGIELEFKKPEAFPELLIDESKLRQIVMNFIDNAIYYTRGGGYIKVSLEDKGEFVDFKVKDNGIGVPKNEQHHLFTKFYRATNAREARPDGTGLGLFMSKKVIIAHGGNVIFESVDKKGSTFGFSLNKSRLPDKESAQVVSSS